MAGLKQPPPSPQPLRDRIDGLPRPLAKPLRDRRDLLVRPLARPLEEFIKAPKPGHLQKLVLGRLEYERGDAEADELCQHQNRNRRNPLAVGQEPEFKEFERQQEDEGNDENHEGCLRRQAIDQPDERRPDPSPRDDGDDAPDDWRKAVPQPCLEEEQQGKNDPERTRKTFHVTAGEISPIPISVSCRSLTPRSA